MKSIFPVVILAVFSACHAEAQLRSDREKDGLSGSVHTLRVEKVRLLAEVGGYHEGSKEVSQVLYDERGNKSEETKYKADGSLVNKSVFAYDTIGNLSAVTVYDPDGSVYLKKTYSQTLRFGERRVEESIVAKGATLLAKTIYSYDNKGRGTELATFDATERPGMKQVMSYGADDKLREIVFFRESNLRTGKAVFSYDGRGNPTGEEDYDEHGLLAERVVFTPGSNEREPVEVTKYNANGNLLSSEIYTREFDDRGNWIRETRSERNLRSSELQPIEITRRTITYY